MDAKKLVTFAFASKRRKLAMLTLGAVTVVGSMFGGGEKTETPRPAAAVTAETTATTAVPAPTTDTTPTTSVTVTATKCDGVHFNIRVAPGDKRDRDGDGIACEKN